MFREDKWVLETEIRGEKRETTERKGKETQKSVNMSILLHNVFE